MPRLRDRVLRLVTDLQPMDVPRYDPRWVVPRCRIMVQGLRVSRFAVVIPVINEGNKLVRQLKRMAEIRIMARSDVLIADGGSDDGSTRPELLADLGVRGLLIKDDAGWLSAQLRMAYAFALHEGYAGIVTIDGSGKDSVEDIDAFFGALDHGFDYVQASRFVAGGNAINTPLDRYIAVRFVHAPLVSLAARRWLTDTTQGYRAYSRRYLLHPDVRPFRAVFQNYELLWYLSARAPRLGLRVTEVATTRRYPKSGPTPTKISTLGARLEILRELTNLLLGRYDP